MSIVITLIKFVISNSVYFQKPNLEHHTSCTGTSHEIPDNSDRILTSDEYSQV